jgi:hypothetical protein
MTAPEAATPLPSGDAGSEASVDPACVPITCATWHTACGAIVDQCGGTLDCGACPAIDAGTSPDVGAPALVVACVTSGGTFDSKTPRTGYYIEYHSADGVDRWVQCYPDRLVCDAPVAACPSGSQCFVYGALSQVSGVCR